jgi:hypothetical protein
MLASRLKINSIKKSLTLSINRQINILNFNKNILFSFTAANNDNGEVKKENTSKVNEKQVRYMRNYTNSQEDYMKKYGSKNRIFEGTATNKAEFFSKALRRSYLNRGVFPDAKHFIPVKRLRKSSDTLLKTYNKGEIVGVVLGREEYGDFDFVVDRKDVKSLIKYEHWETKPLYLKHGDEEIRCNLISYENHMSKLYEYFYRFKSPIEDYF